MKLALNYKVNANGHLLTLININNEFLELNFKGHKRKGRKEHSCGFMRGLHAGEGQW